MHTLTRDITPPGSLRPPASTQDAGAGRAPHAAHARQPTASRLAALSVATLALGTAAATSITLLAARDAPAGLDIPGERQGLMTTTAIAWALSVVAVATYAVSVVCERRAQRLARQAQRDAPARPDLAAPQAPGALVRSQGALNLAARARGDEDAPQPPRADSPDLEAGPANPAASGGPPMDPPGGAPNDAKWAWEPPSPLSPGARS